MFWNKISGIYDFVENTFNGKVNREITQYVASLTNEDDDILECACGTGMFTLPIARRCKSLIATDFADRMLAQAQKKCRHLPNMTFKKADITKLSYADESFDKVVAANVIHLLDDPSKAMSELWRICRKGGVIIIPTYINKSTKSASLAAKAFNMLGAGLKREFDDKSYHEFFEQMGYAVSEYHTADGRMPCCAAIIRKN
ncbi:MAG: class I SAM-dependent methyltransferase [Paludibacteraceae bacterium]|nr:class I SAM-dependent methyltransferase [Paludibacteraceae bacterium]